MSIKKNFSVKDQNCNECMLRGSFRKQGYDWWWHSMTAVNRETGEEKPFYLMVNVGSWVGNKKQLHRFFAWKDVKIHMNAPYSVQAGDCYCDEYRTYGSISLSEKEVAEHPEYLCDAGTVSWDITIEKDIAWNGGNGYGDLKLYKRRCKFLPLGYKLVDDVHAEHIGCEYGEYDHPEPYVKGR